MYVLLISTLLLQVLNEVEYNMRCNLNNITSRPNNIVKVNIKILGILN